jgi:hypothetical protein
VWKCLLYNIKMIGLPSKIGNFTKFSSNFHQNYFSFNHFDTRSHFFDQKYAVRFDSTFLHLCFAPNFATKLIKKCTGKCYIYQRCVFWNLNKNESNLCYEKCWMLCETWRIKSSADNKNIGLICQTKKIINIIIMMNAYLC